MTVGALRNPMLLTC